MAIVKKQIKFDLPIDGVKVKTVDELTDHLTVELVEHLKTGLLAKWLIAREPELAEIIQRIEITDKSDRELLAAILEGLGFETDEQIIDAMFKVQEQIKSRLNESNQLKPEDTDGESLESSIPIGNAEILAGDDAKGKKFVDCDFSGKDLSGVDFSDCIFEKSKFDNSTLVGALFINSKFKDSSMIKANAQGANFESVEILCSTFDDIKAGNSIFINATINRSTFINGYLDHAQMGNIKITNSDFSGSRMTYLNMEGANLKAVRFNGSDFHELEVGANYIDSTTPDINCKFQSIGCDYSNVKFHYDQPYRMANLRFVYYILRKNNIFSNDVNLINSAIPYIYND